MGLREWWIDGMVGRWSDPWSRLLICVADFHKPSFWEIVCLLPCALCVLRQSQGGAHEPRGVMPHLPNDLNRSHSLTFSQIPLA